MKNKDKTLIKVSDLIEEVLENLQRVEQIIAKNYSSEKSDKLRNEIFDLADNLFVIKHKTIFKI